LENADMAAVALRTGASKRPCVDISQAKRRRLPALATYGKRIVDGGLDQMFGLPPRDATFARNAIAIGFAAISCTGWSSSRRAAC
jgi:hypothetical protein